MKKALFMIIIVTFLIIGSTEVNAFFNKGSGTLELNITDAPSDLNITKAFVTISKIDVHSVVISGNDTFGKWYTVAEGPLTYDLIAIKDVEEELGKLNLTSGWYTQIRLYIDKANVTIDGKEYDLKIPSKKIKIIAPFKILNNQSTNLLLDFDVQKSIHASGKNKYILKPVIKVIRQ